MTDLNEFQKAYVEWAATFPGIRANPTQHRHGINKKIYTLPKNWDGDCPCPTGSAYHMMMIKNRYGIDVPSPKPDQFLCKREQAWRRYVKIRKKFYGK